MTTTENKVIQCRRDTAANWASNNPVPKAGEWCFETDTGVTKIGDGATNYNSLAAVGKTDATKAELDKLHNLSTTKTELGCVHGVTSAIQTQLNAKFAKTDIQTSFGETLSDEKVASEKLVKNRLDAKQDGITVANNSMLKASVLSAMNIVGENNSGRRYDEPKTYAKMLSAAHSTFDRSKFTSLIYGTPTITADGIMINNFDGTYSSGLIMPNDIITIGVENKIKIKFTNKKDDAFSQFLLFVRFDNSLSKDFKFTVGIDNKLSFNINSINYNTNYLLTENTNYLIELVSDFSSYIKVYVNGELSYSNTELELSYSAVSVIHLFGNYTWQNNRYLLGEIDLKYLESINNGVQVFSGNKTGIDTIKPDDYTIVGTLTISADGVASGFSNSNYITVPTLPTSGNYTIKGEFTTPAMLDNSIPLGIGTLIDGSPTLLFSLRYNSNNRIRLLARNTNETNTELPTSYQASTNTIYNYKIKVNGASVSFYINDSLVGSMDNFCELLPTLITVGVDRNFSSPFTGSIDLNSFKIYVDSNLVYQPCLKIPYTLAANDKKFIAPVYEDRAKDMAEQFGVAPYHILDEDNGNFAMPYGSVEEKIAPKIVVGHYEDGASAWEQYLDRTMIQRGTMVADTDVTFPCSDEYADTNFTLSCPFSAKTTTGFTPSASGTYIAVGKF